MVEEFDWEVHPELEEFIKFQVNVFLENNKFAMALSKGMLEKTSTKFIDWIDHVIIPDTLVNREQLESLGMKEAEVYDKPNSAKVFKHPDSYLFPLLLTKEKNMEIALKPESLDDFLQVIGNGIEIQGEPFSHLRKAVIDTQGNYVLSAVERRGYDGFTVKLSDDIEKYISVLSGFFIRKRNFDSDEYGLDYTKRIVKEYVDVLDSARVSDAFFRAERAYWQKRNRAGQMQKSRQDSLGLGWGNHDHHTYRSSRANFAKLVDVFETMGYKCREKYYAGENAGWGAQIMEHPVCSIVVFTDVDLNPDETMIDFAHAKFEESETKLGTVGLWVGLHGESILQSGMHHLEARFKFDKLIEDLKQYNIEVMPPFSYFDFLKQAFTKGEVWYVESRRLNILQYNNLITKEQYASFAKEGAIGSHMENSKGSRDLRASTKVR